MTDEDLLGLKALSLQQVSEFVLLVLSQSSYLTVLISQVICRLNGPPPRLSFMPL